MYSLMSSIQRIFETTDEIATALAEELKQAAETAKSEGRSFNMALSGGSTPLVLYKKLAQEPFKSAIPWSQIHFFWGDERCVHPDEPESNYGMAFKCFLGKIQIPADNIHHIAGEADPRAEAERYSSVIKKFLGFAENWPRFDWILLGIGSDGHVASLFPGSRLLWEKKEICMVAEHPLTGQKRITITLPVINNARKISILAAGENKASVVASVLNRSGNGARLPAALVKPRDGNLEWCLDKAASPSLKQQSHTDTFN